MDHNEPSHFAHKEPQTVNSHSKSINTQTKQQNQKSATKTNKTRQPWQKRGKRYAGRERHGERARWDKRASSRHNLAGFIPRERLFVVREGFGRQWGHEPVETAAKRRAGAATRKHDNESRQDGRHRLTPTRRSFVPPLAFLNDVVSFEELRTRT